MNSFLKEGQNQAREYDDDLNHPGQKCGRGVYVTPYINVAEKYTSDFSIYEKNHRYRIVLMCRVNYDKVRISYSEKDYWILNGDGNEIRPYNILIKEE